LQLRKRLAIAMLMVAASACESAPRSASFTASSPKALIVLATPVEGSENTDVFKRVDLGANRFAGDPFKIGVSTYGALSALSAGSNQINVSASDRTVALAIQELPPGEYAWVEYSRTTGSSIYGLAIGGCLNEIAPVYSVTAGDIAILRVDEIALQQVGGGKARRRPPSEAPTDESVMMQFEKARADYPGIVGAAKLLQPVALIRWEKAPSNFFESRMCGEPATFERMGPK
jgi:hypothetical protein